MWPFEVETTTRSTISLVCDKGGYGRVFVRYFTLGGAGFSSFRDMTMDGLPYTPEGLVVPHPHAEYSTLIKPIRDFHLDVGRSKIAGHHQLTISGFNPEVNIADAPQVVWTGGLTGDPNAVLLTTPRPLQIRSTSALDTAGGSGAQAVRIIALDANYVESTLNVALAGTTPVALGTFLRVNSVRATRPDTPTVRGANQGEIIVETADAPLVRVAHMAPGAGRAQQAIFTVPAGRTGHLFYNRLSVFFDGNSPAACLFEVRIWQPGGSWISAFFPRSLYGTSSAADIPLVPPSFPEKTDFVTLCARTNRNHTKCIVSQVFLTLDADLADAVLGTLPNDCILLEDGSDLELEASTTCIELETP